MPLAEYRRKRDFTVTSEPKGQRVARGASGRRFVIQQHAATRLHFDLRLELGRTLVSWAVPKGLPMTHGEKRLAVKVEDHPLSYFDFEGTILKGQYGGGTVQVWDVGTFEPLSRQPLKELEAGKLHFVLHGKKLSGEWYLVRLREENQWLIIRGQLDHRKLTKAEAERSALTGRTMREIARHPAGGQKSAASKTTPPPPPARLSPEKVTFIEPMKARLVEAPPAGEWLYEMKFDGFRSLAYKEGKAVGLVSRTNHNLTPKFPEVADAVMHLRTRQCVVDGEIVALDPKGRPSFQLLQAFELGQERPPIYYYVFDLLAWNGKSLRQWPLEKRRAKLKSLLPVGDIGIRFSSSLGSEAEALLDMVRLHGLEGLIGKRAGSAYEAGRRSGAWIKLKLVREQEFVIGGYTPPDGSRRYIGAILVGYFETGKLRYAGKVGTGFNAAALRRLHDQFSRIATAKCPFIDLPETRAGRYGQGMTAAVMKRCHWVNPQMVARIKFSEWTRDGRLRHPVYLGLREDKPAKAVVREDSA